MITPIVTIAAGTAKNTAVRCSWRIRLFDRFLFEPEPVAGIPRVMPRASGRPTRGITFSSVIAPLRPTGQVTRH